jgi:hypothetical protein
MIELDSETSDLPTSPGRLKPASIGLSGQSARGMGRTST